MTIVQAVEPKTNEVEITSTGFFLKFKEVSDDAKTHISINRTIRIPDNNGVSALPPGMGNFPIRKVEDFSKVPDRFKKYGGYFFPMYNSEAMFLGFSGGSYPVALIIAAGGVNCVTGEKLNRELEKTPQNYIAPGQPWLDGFSTGKDTISQFISMPLGSGTTVEEQVTGEAEFGGLQIIAYPMKKDVYDRAHSLRFDGSRGLSLNECVVAAAASSSNLFGAGLKNFSLGGLSSTVQYNKSDGSYTSLDCIGVSTTSTASSSSQIGKSSGEVLHATEDYYCSNSSINVASSAVLSFNAIEAPIDAQAMGLASGGKMRQQIHVDSNNIEDYDMDHPIYLYINLLNSEDWFKITGSPPPHKALTPQDYKQYNTPWFEHYRDIPTINPSEILSKVKSVEQILNEQGETLGDAAVLSSTVVNL